ncbi:histone-lysine N-methyltransferase ATXR4 isoform X2 [Prosopis cineraria]|uniref:histone-lysine N-methyltransferase ATXR4 isoform X2 n=1 Tax=Prosopis cineraria TaxID=364024 RepID=UPI002410A19B|nr:histone-lysine N-methyltransferase ATXR4 isoform X2 [Prosopis cineraria]
MSRSLCKHWSRLVTPFRIANCGERLQLTAFSSSTTSAEHDSPSRPGPPPIRVGFTESAGRGVFATRAIGAGDLIHTSKPFLCHPSPSCIHAVCYFCLRELRNSTNPVDAGASFCSEECKECSKEFYDVEMKANWMAFDAYCQTHGLKYPFLVKRLACMIISGVASIDSLDILQPASLTPEMILELEEGFALLRNALTKTLIAYEDIAFLSKQWYISVLARIRINAFRVELARGLYEDLLSSAVASVEAEASVGNAVYILPSFYNHDCDPNAHIIWIDNADAKLKALRNIEEGPFGFREINGYMMKFFFFCFFGHISGEELRICYIDASMDRDARQELLLGGFGFQCNCNRCSQGD